MADPLGQAVTHAPQLMQVAASNAASAARFGTGIAWASGAVPVGAEMYPPAWMIRSNALRSTTRSLMTGNGCALNGSISMTSPSEKDRMCSWQVVVCSGPCATPLITRPHWPQMPSRQSLSKAMGSSPRSVRPSFSTSSISRNDMCPETPLSWYETILPLAFRFGCRHTRTVIFTHIPSGSRSLRASRLCLPHSSSLVAALLHLYVLVLQRLLVQDRPGPLAGELPSRHIGEFVVVP